jgi:hypothetical protein
MVDSGTGEHTDHIKSHQASVQLDSQVMFERHASGRSQKHGGRQSPKIMAWRFSATAGVVCVKNQREVANMSTTTSRLLTLKCQNCGANLQIKPDTTQSACSYCGASQIVDRDGGIVSLRLVSDALQKVQVGTDRTAAELAIKRLNDEIYGLKLEIEKLDRWRSGQPTLSMRYYALQLISLAWGLLLLFLVAVYSNLSSTFSIVAESIIGLVTCLVVPAWLIVSLVRGSQKRSQDEIDVEKFYRTKRSRFEADLALRYEQLDRERRIVEGTVR